MTTRFNQQTWQENQSFLQRAKADGTLPEHTDCIYPCSQPVSQFIWTERKMIVLEMNNELNQIVGIGLITNRPVYNKYHVYETVKYNTYAYLGKYHILRSDMTEEEEELMVLLDRWCFKGKRHQKRLQGIKAFPIDILYDHMEAETAAAAAATDTTATTTIVDVVVVVAEKKGDIMTALAGMFKRRFL